MAMMSLAFAASYTGTRKLDNAIADRKENDDDDNDEDDDDDDDDDDDHDVTHIGDNEDDNA
jgi:hypothetical protein